MNVNINSLKRKLLIKYPIFGSVLANLGFEESKEVKRAGTDGKKIYYNLEFLNGQNEKEQLFILVHEVCHVAFKHIYRSEGKDKKLWNIATDAVINALLQKDGLEMPKMTLEINGKLITIKDGIDIPEAVDYDAEEMYNKLLENKKKQKNQYNQDNQGNQDNQQLQGTTEQDENNIEQDSHSLWDKAIEERKKEKTELKEQQTNEEQQDSNQEKENTTEPPKGQENRDEQSTQDDSKEQDSKNCEENQDVQNDNNKSQEEKDKKYCDNSNYGEQGKEKQQNSQSKQDDINKEKEDKVSKKEDLAEQGEKEAFKQNKIERRKQLQELSKELVDKASEQAGCQNSIGLQKLSDIGRAAPLIDWRKLLRQAIKYNEEWTRKNARMRNGYFRHKLEQFPIPETEIVLDVSGSVSEDLLKNFLRECKNIIENSKVKVGCFDTEFHGFTELRRPEDIDNMSFPIGGGTDFNAAVGAFSKNIPNKIVFTDGEAAMPEKMVRNVIWVVFGNREIKPEGGKVIYITEEQLKKLYKPYLKIEECCR